MKEKVGSVTLFNFSLTIEPKPKPTIQSAKLLLVAEKKVSRRDDIAFFPFLYLVLSFFFTHIHNRGSLPFHPFNYSILFVQSKTRCRATLNR